MSESRLHRLISASHPRDGFVAAFVKRHGFTAHVDQKNKEVDKARIQRGSVFSHRGSVDKK